MDDKTDLYTVSRLIREIKWLLLDCFPKLLVEGEISNLSRPRSGHLYFTLKDERSQIRCVMFGGQRRKRPELRDGLHVVVQAQLALYEARGDLQLQVEAIEPVGTGRFQLQFEQLKRKLAAEGLFSAARKKPIPSWPRRIGVITSPSGAAIRDVLKVLRKRFPAIEVILYPCQVQGEEAPGEIIRALAIANRRRECDLLLLVRGGGSEEDLAAFNDERVVRAVAGSELPVVTGIGHEIDLTLADLAADLTAPTPSAAAERISPDRKAVANQLRQLAARLRQAVDRRLQEGLQRLEKLEGRFAHRHPEMELSRWAQRLDELQIKLQHRIASRLEEKRLLLQSLAQRLDDLSPLKTLKRGYAVVLREDGQVVSASRLREGETVQIRFARGSAWATVTRIEVWRGEDGMERLWPVEMGFAPTNLLQRYGDGAVTTRGDGTDSISRAPPPALPGR